MSNFSEPIKLAFSDFTNCFLKTMAALPSWRVFCAGFAKLKKYRFLVCAASLTILLSLAIVDVAMSMMDSRNFVFYSLLGSATQSFAVMSIVVGILLFFASFFLIFGIYTARRERFRPWFILTVISLFLMAIFGFQVWNSSFTMAIFALFSVCLLVMCVRTVWRVYQGLELDPIGRYYI